MTTVTTILALLPVLTSTGKGSDIMIPMAIPIFGGMVIDITSYFIVPVLYSWREELKLKKSKLMRTINIVICLLFVSAFSRAQQLQSFISEAVGNSPEIQAYNLRHNIAEEKINEAVWIPNTEFSAGYFVSEPETRTGAQRARFSAKTNVALVRYDYC